MPKTTTPTKRLLSHLPTEGDYATVTRKLYDAHDAIEQLSWQLGALVDEYDGENTSGEWPAAPPTLADVGALWAFIEAIKLTDGAISDEILRIEDVLSRVDSVRLDLRARTG